MQNNKDSVLHYVNLKDLLFATSILGCFLQFNPLNAELNPIRHLLALVGARHIVHVSRIRVNEMQDLATIFRAIICRSVLIFFHPQQSRWRPVHTLGVLRCPVVVKQTQSSGIWFQFCHQASTACFSETFL